VNGTRRLIFKTKDKMWSNVTWECPQLVVFYLDAEVDDVRIEETRELDFEELLFRLDTGCSVFMTLKPLKEPSPGREVKSEWL